MEYVIMYATYLMPDAKYASSVSCWDLLSKCEDGYICSLSIVHKKTATTWADQRAQS